jgi:hypothetical protein
MNDWAIKKESDLSFDIVRQPGYDIAVPKPKDFSDKWKVKNESELIDWARIGYQGLGGVIGGMIPPYDPITTPIKIGLGSSMAGQAYDRVRELMGDKKADTLLSAGKQATEDFIFDTIAPEAISKGLTVGKKVVGYPLRRMTKGARGLEKYTRVGIMPTAGTVTQNKALMIAENALSDYPFSSTPIQKLAQKNIEQLNIANEYLAKEYGNILTREELGALLKKGAEGAIDRLDKVYNKLFSRLGDEISDVQLNNTREIFEIFKTEAIEGPSTGIDDLANDILGKAKAREKKLRAVGVSGLENSLPWEAIKKHRTKIGNMIKEPGLISSRNLQRGDLKRLYSALTKDMEKAAMDAGPKTYAKWQAANKYYQHSLIKKVPILEQIIKKGYDEEVFDVVMRSAKKGGTRLRTLRKEMSNDEWDAVSATVFSNLGKATPEDAFSLNTFFTNWKKKLSPEAKSALWRGTRHQELAKELDNFVSVVGDMKSIEQIANKSKTGSVLMFYGIFQSLSATAGAVAAGIPGAATTTFITMAAAPYYVSRLITNPKFVKWLANGIKISKTRPNAMATHIGRLFTLAEKENLEDEVGYLFQNNIWFNDENKTFELQKRR